MSHKRNKIEQPDMRFNHLSWMGYYLKWVTLSKMPVEFLFCATYSQIDNFDYLLFLFWLNLI